MGRGGSASLPRPARRSGRSARPPQPRCRHCRPHTSEPGLTAQLRAGCRRLIGARAAGATSAHRGPRRRQASARRNPRQQPGCRPRSRSGLSSGAPGLDRPFSPPPPAVSCLFNGRMGMRAARLVRQARCAPAEEPSPAVRRKRVRPVRSQPPFLRQASSNMENYCSGQPLASPQVDGSRWCPSHRSTHLHRLGEVTFAACCT